LASADWKEVSHIVVDLEYADPDSDFRMATSLSFQKETPQRQPWKFPIRNPKHREFTYTQTLLMVNGGAATSEPKTRNSDAGVLVVGNAPGGVVTVEVDPTDTGIGNDVSRVIARLTYADPDNQVLDTETLVFRDGVMKEWQIARADATRNQYTFDVEYFLKNGARARILDQPGTITSTREILFLPAPPA
jgi:hypothetical protein